jgi:hypothetical protein
MSKLEVCYTFKIIPLLFIMIKRFLGLAAMMMFLGAGCGAPGAQTAEVALGYALPSDGSITVTSTAINAEDVVSADALLAQAEECGYARAAEYYLDIENLFSGTKGAQYTFKIAGDYEMPTWTVTVLPNAPAYSAVESFKNDFDICAAGGSLYPKNVSADALLFTDSCGGGYSGGKENGCDVIRAAVESTLTM